MKCCKFFVILILMISATCLWSAVPGNISAFHSSDNMQDSVKSNSAVSVTIPQGTRLNCSKGNTGVWEST